MAPQKEKTETLELDSINPGLERSINNKPQFLKGTSIGIKDSAKQQRINTLHYVIHTLSFMIIIPFLFMVFIGKEIPAEYSTIVSIVIGFYFGKSLLNR